MAEFVPVDKQDKKESQSAEPKDSALAVQKAKDAAEIQKHETERIKAQREAVFIENDIKDTADLKTRMAAITEKENKLAKDFMEFDNRKATELSEAQKLKAEHERKLVDIVKREQDLATRIRNVELREKLVQEREELMNSVEKQKLEDTEKQNSLVERLKKAFPKIIKLMEDTADILDVAGFHGLSDDLFDDFGTMLQWAKNDIVNHSKTMVEWLKGQVEDCNQKAVEMARNPKAYNQATWDSVVDNLEEVYKLLPELRPSFLPSDTEPSNEI